MSTTHTGGEENFHCRPDSAQPQPTGGEDTAWAERENALKSAIMQLVLLRELYIPRGSDNYLPTQSVIERLQRQLHAPKPPPTPAGESRSDLAHEIYTLKQVEIPALQRALAAAKQEVEEARREFDVHWAVSEDKQTIIDSLRAQLAALQGKPSGN